MKKTILVLTMLLITMSGLYSQSSTKMLDKKQTQQLKKLKMELNLVKLLKSKLKN